jgi:hypothetical protein
LEDKIALLCAGSLDLGQVSGMVTDFLQARQDMQIIVPCGRNHTLRSSYNGQKRVVVLEWRNDLPELFVTADAVVHNTGGMGIVGISDRKCSPHHIPRATWPVTKKCKRACREQCFALATRYQKYGEGARSSFQANSNIILKWTNQADAKNSADQIH